MKPNTKDNHHHQEEEEEEEQKNKTIKTNTGNGNNNNSCIILENYRIEGISVGGQETCLIFPQLKISFDIGRCPQRSVYSELVLLTHTHMDHVGGLGMFIASRNLLHLQKPEILCPEEKVEDVSRFLEALKVLDDSELPHDLIAFSPPSSSSSKSNNNFFRMKNKRYVVKCFRTIHPVPSQGYVIYSTKQKLKDEYLKLSGNEIKELKFKGVEISDTIDVPEICFTGDTTIDWINQDNEDNDVIKDGLKAKVLVMECTFVNDEVSIEQAIKFGHTHVKQIAENSQRFLECGSILLIHFSARYKREEIIEGLKANLSSIPELYKKITPLLVGYC
jgi:ribonuclease Z